jgi:hypothetical protein
VSLLDSFSTRLVLPRLEVASSGEVQVDVSYRVHGEPVEAALHAQYAMADPQTM